MDLTQLLLNGAGGAIVGPLVAHFLGGKDAGLLKKVIAGVVGGVGAGAGAEAAGLDSALLGSDAVMQMIQAFLEGGLGGGVLSTIAGAALKKK